MAAKKMPAKKMPAKSAAPKKIKPDDTKKDVVPSYNVGPVSEAAANVRKKDIKAGVQARSKASKFGYVTGRTEVYRYGTKNQVDIFTPVTSKSGVKGGVYVTKKNRRFLPDVTKTTVSWQRGRGGTAKPR